MDADKVNFDQQRAIQELTEGLRLMSQVCLLVKESNHSEAGELCQGVMDAVEAGLSLVKSAEDQSEIESASSSGLMNRRSAKAVQAEDRRRRDPNGRREGNSKKIITDSPFGDGYEWRKYGQKVIRNTEHPRCYYKCSYKDCKARKQVQQVNSGDAPDYEVTFFHEHTCNCTELSASELMPPSPTRGLQIISFESNDHSSPRLVDGEVFSTLSTDACTSALPQATALENLDESLDLIAPLSPAGQFFGSDASTYSGLEEPFDPFLPYRGN